MTGQPAWEEYGPAEFDRARCPKGAREAPGGQAALFVVARDPLPPKPAALPGELDGQEALFGGESP